ncbi:hypothetical protein [Rheinheimera aquimaris]|uniref:hypothetical protein n=1 Tax=Rheinheimera aquimaris TaxID=412437 RepID=UPI001064AF17|nr:hypothetical protein [Rheinheimera aquimaris]
MELNRTINKANTHRIAVNSYSYKNHAIQAQESLHEVNTCDVLEFNQHIKRYITQPMTFMNYGGEPGWRQYTPDLLIEYLDGSLEFGEIKVFSATQKESFKSKFELHKHIVKERTGKNLVLFTDENLSAGLLAQYKQLKPFLAIQLAPQVNAQVIDLVKNKRITLREVEAFVVALGLKPQYAMALIAQNLLKTVDMTIITRNSLVELST